MIRLGVLSLDHPHAAGNHLPALRFIQDRVAVRAIAHPDRAAAAPWLELFHAEWHADRADLLRRADIDAVLVTSTNDRHAEDTIAAARAGKDVLCDKPIATRREDAKAIEDAVLETGVRFVTTFPVRFNSSVRALKSAVDAGELGEIRAVMATNHGCMYEPGAPDWVRDPLRNGGGCLIDHTVHVADIIRWISGQEFTAVAAETATALREQRGEDIGVLHGEMERGAIFQIDASWSRRGGDPMWGDVTFRVVGTKGSATLDLYNNQRMELYGPGGVTFHYPNFLVREHAEVFLDYAAARTTGARGVYADQRDGRRALELVFAAYESVRTGRRCPVGR